jgi:hypothetical protein
VRPLQVGLIGVATVLVARPDCEEGRRADVPPIVGGNGDDAYEALLALARRLRPPGGAMSGSEGLGLVPIPR